MIQFDDTKINKSLKFLREQEEEELVQHAAQTRGLPYIDLSKIPISTEALSVITEEKAKDIGCAGFKVVGSQLHIAALSEQHPAIGTLLKELQLQGYVVALYLASHKSLGKAWSRYEDLKMTKGVHGSFIDISPESIQEIAEQVKTNNDVKTLFEDALGEDERKRTSRLMEIIMGSAIAMKSSDVHIEPEEGKTRMRFRQDGILQDIIFFNHDVYKQLASRIKILSGMKLNIVKNAQDGRFTIDFNKTEIEVRSSTVPGSYGEGIVMRVLDPRGIAVGLEQLGIEPLLFEILKKEIDKPSGLILNTGPTGSGKTTTLYSFLKYIYNPEIKIITIEDPIEYHLEGIHQTQVDHKTGYDFESGLRAAMRQDPDVILVGEIRDHETALAAMQASQTGHLVFSTLHTNSAAGTVPRLLDLGINHSTLAQSMSVAIAQRLVRKLTDTKKKVKPTPEQENVMRVILKNATDHGKDLSRFDITPDMELWVYEKVPSDIAPSGYKGRIGIFEAILINDDVKEILDQKPTDRQVKEIAHRQGILTMAEDAVVKLIQGVTSYEEVSRVIDLEEDIREQLVEYKNTHTSSDPTQSAEHPSDTITKNDLVSQIQNNLRSETISNLSPRSGEISKVTQPNDASLPSQEVNMLVDYLSMLENHQREYPDTGVANKIAEVQQTIIKLLETYHPNDLFLQRDNERIVKEEIDTLMQELESLRKHQTEHPDVGIADKLRSIRITLQSLAKK